MKKLTGYWAMELLIFLWSLRTSPSRATDYTSFLLAFGIEAMLHIELEYGSPRVQAFSNGQGTTDAQISSDLLDEAQNVVVVCSSKYQ